MPRIRNVDYIENAENIIIGLKCARKMRGYSQTDAARMVGRSQNWLSDTEKGNTELSLKKACEIADLYGKELRLCDRG